MMRAAARIVVLGALLGWSRVGSAQADALRAEVEARQAELDAAHRSGEFTLLPLPPRDETTHELPSLVSALVTARARYLTAPDADRATRWEYELANAELMLRYGHPDWALEAYRRVYRESCRIDGNVAERARGMMWLTSVETHAEWPERLIRTHSRAGVCLYGDRELAARERAIAEVGPCAPPLPPGAVEYSDDILINRTYSPALEFYHQADEARAAGRPYVAFYEAAARELLSAIARDDARPPECRSADVPRALLLAGQALAYAHRPRAAADLMERAMAIAESSPDAWLLAVSLYNAGENARNAGDYDRALGHWARLYDEERFALSPNAEMPAMRIDAMVEAARLLTWIDRHAEAAALFDRLAATDPDPDEARLASLLALEQRAAMPDPDRRALAETARSFLARADLSTEEERRALEVLVRFTRGRAHRDAEAQLRALPSMPSLPDADMRPCIPVPPLDATE